MAAAHKTKKLINSADNVIAELIEGMIGAHPDLLRLDGTTGRAIVAVDGPRDGKVGIVIGGGSGHEPLFSGYVGRGMADASAVGNVFASPSPGQICDAARAADGGSGVLFLYGNYTGDVMNFDMAAESLAEEGILARSFQVRDDVASAPLERREERRGIAGNLFVLKVAGAAADMGLSFEDVVKIARRADGQTASMGVALGPCSLPHTLTPNFEIGPDEMEVGMGIHGEPGIERIALETADQVADRLLDPVLADLNLARGDRVAILVNGLGSTSMMELYILHRRFRSRLAEEGISIYRNWVGNYATSLEMAGASVSLIKLDDQLQTLLDHPCRTPSFQVEGSWQTTKPAAIARKIKAGPHDATSSPQESAGLVQTGTLTPEIFRQMMLAVADRIGEERDYLCELDGAIGDGDHGVTMDLGWRAIRTSLEESEDRVTISQMCRHMSAAFLNAVGASAGPLYATGLSRAGSAVADRQNLDAVSLAHWLKGMSQGIAERGGAGIGDKTMFDAWEPAARAAGVIADAGGSVADCLCAAAEAAESGKSATASMQARLGRASKLGERTLGRVDPGAASAAIIVSTLAEFASNNAL